MVNIDRPKTPDPYAETKTTDADRKSDSCNDLLPCPFCGSGMLAMAGSRFGYAAHCMACEATGTRYGAHDDETNKQRAREAWNRRAG